MFGFKEDFSRMLSSDQRWDFIALVLLWFTIWKEKQLEKLSYLLNDIQIIDSYKVCWMKDRLYLDDY